ncbi:hypothetical protein VNO77_04226 [Canavalia gladiata]|uniref:Uncharacterized protein n=1 Tax=Canavalia gladiata TaxID=3824 RepID=A0AAN9MW54_CANGL
MVAKGIFENSTVVAITLIVAFAKIFSGRGISKIMMFKISNPFDYCHASKDGNFPRPKGGVGGTKLELSWREESSPTATVELGFLAVATGKKQGDKRKTLHWRGKLRLSHRWSLSLKLFVIWGYEWIQVEEGWGRKAIIRDERDAREDTAAVMWENTCKEKGILMTMVAGNSNICVYQLGERNSDDNGGWELTMVVTGY